MFWQKLGELFEAASNNEPYSWETWVLWAVWGALCLGALNESIEWIIKKGLNSKWPAPSLWAIFGTIYIPIAIAILLPLACVLGFVVIAIAVG